jgi:putative peptidoglycan lipid II flippase
MDLHRSALTVGLLTLVSRITGLLREVVHAAFLGTGMGADAFRIAFLLPNLLRRLVGEGAVSSAFVPVYTGYLQKHEGSEERVFAEKFLTFWLVLVTLFTVVGIALAGWIVSAAFDAGSFSDTPGKLELTVDLSRILFWYLLLIGGVAAVQGILHARAVFGAASFAPVAFNLVFVASAYLLVPVIGPDRAPYALAFAVLIGGVVQLLVLFPALFALGVRLRPRYPLDHAGVRQVMRLLVPGTLGAGVYQINVVVNTALAARLQEGAVSSLGYSNRLMEFVLGIFVFALGTVSLTELSRNFAEKNLLAFQATLDEVLRLCLFISIPSTVGLYLLRDPILAVLFENGNFDQASRELTATAFRYHVLGITFVGCNRLLVAAFHAQKDLKTPVIQGAGNMVVNVLLAYGLSRGALGYAGVALAASVAAPCLTVPLLLIHLRRMPGLPLRRLCVTLVKTLVASGVMGLVCFYGLSWAGPWTSQSKIVQGILVATLIGAGAATFFAMAWALRLDEVRVLFSVLKRRRGSNPDFSP